MAIQWSLAQANPELMAAALEGLGRNLSGRLGIGPEGRRRTSNARAAEMWASGDREGAMGELMRSADDPSGIMNAILRQEAAIRAEALQRDQLNFRQSQPLEVGGNLLNPQTYETIYTAPKKPVEVGDTLVDPDTFQEVYRAPPKAAPVPSGYQASPTGLAPVPGGPADPATIAAQNAARRSPLMAGDRKELFEADEGIQAAGNVTRLLDHALDLNDKAYSGIGASKRSYLESVLPDWASPDSLTGGSVESANATQELQNTVMQQVLDNLKATFGGMPTEGERQVLVDVQGSVNQSPAVRKAIFERAKMAAQKRIVFNKMKASSLREGSYFQPGGGPRYDDNGDLVAGPAATAAQPVAPTIESDPTNAPLDLRQGVTAPPAAIEYLRAHPEAADAFDEKYGVGASTQILGR